MNEVAQAKALDTQSVNTLYNTKQAPRGAFLLPSGKRTAPPYPALSNTVHNAHKILCSLPDVRGGKTCYDVVIVQMKGKKKMKNEMNKVLEMDFTPGDIFDIGEFLLSNSQKMLDFVLWQLPHRWVGKNVVLLEPRSGTEKFLFSAVTVDKEDGTIKFTISTKMGSVFNDEEDNDD